MASKKTNFDRPATNMKIFEWTAATQFAEDFEGFKKSMEADGGTLRVVSNDHIDKGNGLNNTIVWYYKEPPPQKPVIRGSSKRGVAAVALRSRRR